MKTLQLIKQTTILGFTSSIVLFTPLATNALTVEEVTNPRQNNGGWVTDMADILSDRTETELNSLISNLEQSNGAEIAVVTVPETTPAESPKAFATELFNYWGIGKAETDNGILFLISTADKRVEIETGYGIEGILPDAEVAKIIDDKITPQYKQGNYDRGTLDGTRALVNSLDSTITDENSKFNLLAIWVGIGIASVGGLIWSINKYRKVLIDPSKAITSLNRQDYRSVCCAKCKQPMEKVDNVELTKVQQVAKKVGSVSYRGYKCSDCSNPLQPYSLIAYTSNSSRYQKCPHCNEFTATRTNEILTEPSYTNEGKRLVRDICHCCDYSWETTYTIPRKPRPTHTNSSNSSSNSIYYGGGCSGSSGGGCSGSSGGFGGGSSDGGGAGGDW